MTWKCLRPIVLCGLLSLVAIGSAPAQTSELEVVNGRIEQALREGRFADAVAAGRHALVLTEAQRGPDHLDVALALNRLAVAHLQQGQFAEAEPLFKRAITIRERALGPQHTDVGTATYGLAVLYVQQGRYQDAEPLYKRALAIKEKALGAEHSEVGTVLFALGALYVYTGRTGEAEPLYRRALAIKETVLGPDHSEVGSALHNLAVLLDQQGRHAEAEPLFLRVIAIKEKALGPEHTEVGTALFGLAELYAKQGRAREAEPIYRRLLLIKEKALGLEHPEVATALGGLASALAAQGRHAEADAMFEGALAIQVQTLGAEHPAVGALLSEMAGARFNRQDWTAAADLWQRAAQIVIARARRGAAATGQTLATASEAHRERVRFEGLVKASHRVALQDAARAPEIAAAMFAMAQWSGSSRAAASLEQMAARQAKGSGPLAGLVREQQDLAQEWQAKDKALTAARASPPERRNARAEAAIAERLEEIDKRRAVIDRALAKDFPEYAAAASPEPIDLASVQALLRGDEALVMLFDTGAWPAAAEETFVWVVTRDGARWTRSALGRSAIAEHVAALRCGLDQFAWDREGAAACATLLPGHMRGALLPFDLQRAHALYLALFGQVEDLIADKHLLLVPSGSLTMLPFHVLVTQATVAAIPGDPSAYGDVAWFGKRYASSILPSVASLGALRRFAKSSQAREPFIGFGNPLLSGPDGNDRRAWAKESCPKAGSPIPASATRGVSARLSSFFLNALADVNVIRGQPPLPETADELCAVARSAGAGERTVHLGSGATEANIKLLSREGALANARIVHFATHGLLSSESSIVTGTQGAEPALLLTPPSTASEMDDGLLTASEVAQLKLDADWVVLSACNTAAGTDKDAEPMSGLARAFFYAGARALLVSHWAVDSQATVTLVTRLFSQIGADQQVGRAEALRRSMTALINSGDFNSHPSRWAPFVVVGEGAR